MKRREDHQFDEQIRQKMNNLQPDTAMPDWDAFEERLGAAEELDAGPAQAEPREVDEVIFNKMNQYEAPYEPAHWYRMEAMLNEWFTWPQYVLRYKAMELALFLLLFITCWQYLSEMRAPIAGAAPAQEENYSVPSTAPAGLDGNYEPGQLQEGDRLEGKADNAASRSPEANSLTAGHTPPTATVSPTGQQPRTSENNTALPQQSIERHLTALEPLPSALGITSLASSYNTASRELPLSVTEHLSKMGTVPSALAEADLLPGRPFQALAGPLADLGDTKVKRIRKRPTLVVGMFGSADYNHIVVPASSEKRLSESFERAALGYGGGLSLSADFGRLEVETGAIYAARHYPVGIVYVRGGLLSGLSGDELRTTELNMLNIPVHLRYDVVQHNKWRVYALGGGSVQVAFQTNYYTAEAPQFYFMPALPPPATDGGGESEIDRIRRDGQGWLEGGSFKDNSYLTLNLGFGAERYFSERWSLFVQPFYQHSIHYFKNIDGLGPNNDRINSLSVLFGTRVRLRR